MTLTPRDQPTASNLSAAVDELHRQVSLLLNPRRQRFNRGRATSTGRWVDDGPVEHVTVPSLWQQLHAALGNSRTLTAGGGRPGSKLPLDAGVLDVVAAITGTVNAQVLALGLTPRIRAAEPTCAPTRVQQLPAGRHADDRTPWHDPQLVGQLTERHAATRAAVTDRTNLARVLQDTPSNLRQVTDAVVRTRDVERIAAFAATAAHWVAVAETALAMEEEGTDTRGLRGFACPDCRSTHVTRVQDGETFRDAAVVAVLRDHQVRNFACRRCGALWWRGTDSDHLITAANRERNAVHTHFVAWTIEREHVQGSFTCTAPAGADCRLICPEGCEAWPCGHKLVDAGECNVMSWISLADPAESYAGDPEPLRSGPIRASWDGADMTWEYAEPAVTDQADAEDPSVQVLREAVGA